MVVGCIVDFFLKIWDTTDDLYHHIIRRYRSQSIRDNSKTNKKSLRLLDFHYESSSRYAKLSCLTIVMGWAILQN